MKSRALAAMTALLFTSSTLTAFAQKSRRILREEGLNVQTSTPVGETPGGAAASPELYGTDGGATKAAIAGPTGVTALTGRVQDTGSLLLSSGNGTAVPVVAAPTASTAFIPTTSNDQSMMLPLLAALAGALGGASNGAKASTGTTGTTTSATPPSTSTASPPESAPAMDATGAPVHGRHEQSSSACKDYQDRDPISPPIKGRFNICSCDADREEPFLLNISASCRSAKPSDVFPVATGKIVSIDSNTAYGCRIIVEHNPCPVKSIAASGPCFTVYGGIGQSGKCPDGSLAVDATVQPGDKIGSTQKTSGERNSVLKFEFRLQKDGRGVATEKYECAFTTHGSVSRRRKGDRCSKKPNQPESFDTIQSFQQSAPAAGRH